jgi:hypothetical protein
MVLLARFQEFLRRLKGSYEQPSLFQQTLERATHQLVVIHDSDRC